MVAVWFYPVISKQQNITLHEQLSPKQTDCQFDHTRIIIYWLIAQYGSYGGTRCLSVASVSIIYSLLNMLLYI